MDHDVGSNVLGSLVFLLTGTNKAALRAKIQALGGTILDLPDWQVSSELACHACKVQRFRSLCAAPRVYSRLHSASLVYMAVTARCFPACTNACRVRDLLGLLLQEGEQRQPPFDAVVASNAEPRKTVKILLARWLGRPVLEPGWVEACCSARELQPMAGKLAVLEERPPCQAVAGKRVYLHGQQLRNDFALLLQYAGRTAFCAPAECLRGALAIYHAVVTVEQVLVLPVNKSVFFLLAGAVMDTSLSWSSV